MASLVYPELSYKIVGILFEVHNKLGGGYQEKSYQKAIEVLLNRDGVMFHRELKADLVFENEKIDIFFLDFLIEDKIVLELKAKPSFTSEDYRQVRTYLKVNNLRLGILANFRGERISYKRILNPV
jgi:GxxExxY protein